MYRLQSIFLIKFHRRKIAFALMHILLKRMIHIESAMRENEDFNIDAEFTIRHSFTL